MLNQITDRPTQEEIAARAQQIYEQEGRLEGHALEHWMRAARELREQFDQAGAPDGPTQPPPDSAAQMD